MERGVMSKLVSVDENNFETEVVNSKIPVLVDFGATWCGPCQKQLPILEKFANENLGTFKVCKVDIDDAPDLAAKFNIRGVPTIALFSKGVNVDTKVGLTSPSALKELVAKLSK